jgi:hypothetical protein
LTREPDRIVPIIGPSSSSAASYVAKKGWSGHLLGSNPWWGERCVRCFIFLLAFTLVLMPKVQNVVLTMYPSVLEQASEAGVWCNITNRAGVRFDSHSAMPIPHVPVVLIKLGRMRY